MTRQKMSLNLRNYSRWIVLAIAVVGMSNCAREEKFEDLSDKVASPIDVASSSDGSHFYVLNADFDRTYNKGSILVIDREGNKKTALSVSRLGRSLSVAGNFLAATFNQPDEDAPAKIQIYDVSNPASPTLKFDQALGCLPINIAMRANYRYFAIACLGGGLIIGDMQETLTPENTELFLVRHFGHTRRAMFLDPNRNLLFAFVTRMDQQGTNDLVYSDVIAYNEETDEVKSGISNEVPDVWEETARNRKKIARRRIYQFVVYNIGAEADHTHASRAEDPEYAKGVKFPYRNVASDPLLEREFRWIYFSLRNHDGTPDEIAPAYTNPSEKYYRTNFWEAKPDLLDPNVFYLSQRGTSESPNANHVLRVRIIGDIAAESGAIPATRDVLNFERIYGFNRTEDPGSIEFPGDFEFLNFGGQKVIVVNHFKDFANFRNNARFSVTAKVIGNHNWYHEIADSSYVNSYYQVAPSTNGRFMTCSFYGNSVSIMDVTPGSKIDIVKIIQ